MHHVIRAIWVDGSLGKVQVIWWWWQDWRWINQISKTDYADYMGWLTTRENFGRFNFSIFAFS
jgi:hypothetical protein